MSIKLTLCVVVISLLAGTVETVRNSTSSASPRIVVKVALSGQTGTIPATTIFTPSKDGLFRVSAYMVETQSATNPPSTWILSLNWTDEFGPELCANLQPCQLATLDAGSTAIGYGTSMGVTGQPPNTMTVIRAKAGTPITYSVGYENNPPQNAQYDLFLSVEQLM